MNNKTSVFITPIRKCPICEGSKAEILHIQRFVLPEGHPLSDGYDVVCCGRCGFVYADTMVSQEDYERFYSKFSKYEDQKGAMGGAERHGTLNALKKQQRKLPTCCVMTGCAYLIWGALMVGC